MGRYKNFVEDWGNNEFEAAIALQSWLDVQFTPQSVIDIGCGAGVFLTLFQTRGVDILGVDLETNARTLLDTDFLQFDLQNELILEKKYDLALCLEVIEHLDKQYEKTLIKSISNAADIIVFSGAKPNQVGENHINCNTKEYWLELFQAEGIVYWPEQNAPFQEFLKVKEFNQCPWLRENMMILHRV